jgi:SRSO17 transposase
MKKQYSFGQPPKGMDVLWRCEAKRYSICLDPEAERYGSSAPQLEVTWWKVDKRTSKGAWVCGKFVLLTARKQWASNTEQEAIASFIARKNRQISILTAQLVAAKADLALTQEHIFA